MRTIYILLAFIAISATAATASAEEESVVREVMIVNSGSLATPPDSIEFETISPEYLKPKTSSHTPISIYELPYSLTLNSPDWKRLWINTGVYASAFVGTLLVLQCLPEDATSWNRAAIQDVPPFKRWFRNIFKRGPEWDHDKFYFNYILHPYAGAVYFMAARSCGFNFWRSFLYSSIISNVGWEFGVEAFMERPSYQDLFITPCVGSIIGECFYRIKRGLVRNDYRLCGSPVLGNIVAFLVDPVNEVVGLFSGNPARQLAKANASASCVQSSFMPLITGRHFGFTLTATF